MNAAEPYGGKTSSGIAVLAWLVLLFLTLPTLVIIPMSFGSGNFLVFPPRGFSLHLYQEFFAANEWTSTTLVSVRVAFFSTVLSLILGSTAAYGLVRTEFRGKQLVTLALLSPMFVPGIVKALAFYIYFALIGLQGSEIGLVLAHAVLIVPYVVVVMMAALSAVDPALERAAQSMGASRLYTFRRVTLPLVRNGLVAAALFGFLLSFDELIVALFLADMDTRTLPMEMFENIKFDISPVLAAVSTLLTVAAFLLSIVVARSRSLAPAAISRS